MNSWPEHIVNTQVHEKPESATVLEDTLDATGFCLVASLGADRVASFESLSIDDVSHNSHSPPVRVSTLVLIITRFQADVCI